MRRCLLVFLSVLPLLVTGCKKGEGNLTQSTPSQTPVAQATPTPPPDTNRTAKFIVLLYHRFEDRPAELVTTPNDFRAQMKVLKKVTFCAITASRFARRCVELVTPTSRFGDRKRLQYSSVSSSPSLWAHSYRSLGQVRVWSRNRLSLDTKFQVIHGAVKDLGLRSTILDGGVVARHDQGIPRFELLQKWQKRPTVPLLS
jgi:hypothetical protein